MQDKRTKWVALRVFNSMPLKKIYTGKTGIREKTGMREKTAIREKYRVAVYTGFKTEFFVIIFYKNYNKLFFKTKFT